MQVGISSRASGLKKKTRDNAIAIGIVSVFSVFLWEVGVVKRVHSLLGGVHRLATALKVVKEVQEEVEIKDE